MKSKQKKNLQIQRIFTWSNNGGTDTFLRANICAADTPDIVISRDDRREISLRVSLVHLRLYSCEQHLADTLAPIFPKPRGHPCTHVFHCPPIKYIR